MGSRWVHLRTCQTCGGTRCCDSSPNRHAGTRPHAGHPVIASAEEGERWLYCYPHDALAAGLRGQGARPCAFRRVPMASVSQPWMPVLRNAAVQDTATHRTYQSARQQSHRGSIYEVGGRLKSFGINGLEMVDQIFPDGTH